jgi:tRNA A-37 threonylcarbamoyl transferase component Bud32
VTAPPEDATYETPAGGGGGGPPPPSSRRGSGSIPEGTVLLDKYRVLRELGVGGMSRVVCAEHVSLGTKVAMKFLLPELACLPDAPQRFEREATAATRFESDHVARVLDVGTLPGGPPYMVMEYLEGKDLGRYVREGKRFAVDEAIELVVQAADALARAHAAGVVHRDVKPSNLFLTHRPDGSPLVKVLDFGISKVIEEAAKENLELTKTSAVMGSALYMSLEQMRSTKTVDHRTDIYALGVSLYELLTGTHPFTGESISELCVKVSLDPPEPLRKHRPDVPDALAEALEVAYARNAAERYQTTGSFVAALAPFAAPGTRARIDAIRSFERASYPDGKIPQRQLTPLYLRATDAQRPRRLGWVVYAVLAGVGLAAAGVLWVALGPSPHPDPGSTGTAPSATITDAGPDTGAADAEPPAIPSGGAMVVPALSGSVGVEVDGGKAGKPPRRPCKPGEMVVFPNGLRKPCGM